MYESNSVLEYIGMSSYSVRWPSMFMAAVRPWPIELPQVPRMLWRPIVTSKNSAMSPAA